jgi:ferric-dicitrate binding protein FerR (iron transport regulator)
MSRHILPHVWADLAAGRAKARVAAAAVAHAASCAACAQAKADVERMRGTLTDLRGAEPPPIAWDAVGAQVHWRTSSTRRMDQIAGPTWWRRPLWVGSVAALGVAAAIAIWGRSPEAPAGDGRALAPTTAPGATKPVAGPLGASGADRLSPLVPALAAPTPLEGLVTLVAGPVSLDGAPLTLDAAIRAGSRLVTGEGTVHVQFGERSGFVLEPRSVLELVAFDGERIELRVEGGVGVEVSHRRPEQRFAVVAAGRRIEVRGTVFSVRGGDRGLDVAVTRGRVAVVDGQHQVDVPAGMALSVPLAAALLHHEAKPMGDARARAMAQALTVITLPGFDAAPPVRAGSGLVVLRPPPRQSLALDGVPLPGVTAEVRVRAWPGRHQVRVGAVDRWVEIDRGGEARADLAASTGRGTSERAGQVEAELARHHARLAVCAARARSADPDLDASLVVELEIDGHGNLAAVVPVKGLADPTSERCVIDVIREHFTFPPGHADTVRKAIRL